MHDVEVARTRLSRRIAFCAPRQQEFATLVEFRDARAVVAVGDEQGAVWKPGEESGPVEVLVVGAGLAGRAKGLDQELAIIGEFENYVVIIIHYLDEFSGP